MDNNYLAHYGVLGMKWGVRRYQNADGTLTAEGRRRARKEVRADNKEAFEKGKRATIAARAYKYAQVKERKAENKYIQKPNQRRLSKLEKTKALSDAWAKQVDETMRSAEQHYNELVNKYGDKAISQIRKDKNGFVNEEVHDQWAYSLMGASGASLVAHAVLHTPFAFIYIPRSANSMGRAAYRQSKDYLKYAESLRDKNKNDNKSWNSSNWESYKNDLREHKSEYLDRAKKKGTFDMEFLERAPQEKNGHAITDAELIKEYSKYLDDPDKYNK